MNVLIIDDSKVGRMYVERVLELEGHTSIAAGNATVAMQELMGEVRFGAITTDLYMPDKAGDDLTRDYRDKAGAAGKDPDIPVILPTGSQDLARPAQVKQAGFYEIMIMPPDYNRLRKIPTDIEPGPVAGKKADVPDPFRAMMGEMMSAITQSKDIETAQYAQPQGQRHRGTGGPFPTLS
ncbi:MAG: response regulator [Candidatus Marinimicrobia bacterium]|nr:response regulator [Candidatus Neomarinimicrobiota bacterium]